MIRASLLLCLVLTPAVVADAAKVEFNDTERIVFLGNDFFDHEIDQGYIETVLTSRFPQKNLTFRNLGYSGDNVWCDARTLCSGWDQFGPAEQGFERLKKLLGQIKPTLIFVAYGMNESFQGQAGLDHFRDGLNRLLDMLTADGARVVLISPIPHENLGSPLPDPAAHNRDLLAYNDAISHTVASRSLPFLDLFAAMQQQSPGKRPLTRDGIHLTSVGYRRVASLMLGEMGHPAGGWEMTLDATTGSFSAEGIGLKALSHRDGLALTASSETLPAPLPSPAQEQPLLRATNLEPGSYSLEIDGKLIATADATEWARGVPVTAGPDVDQAKALRKKIVEKNFDFFNYWRPENDTYIFGYRKHEQGRNAVEIPKFDEMIPAKESEIAKLRVPVPHKYVLKKSKAN